MIYDNGVNCIAKALTCMLTIFPSVRLLFPIEFSRIIELLKFVTISCDRKYIFTTKFIKIGKQTFILTCSLVTHSLTHSLNNSLTHSLTYSLAIHSLTHSLATHLLTCHSLTHSLTTHSLSHSLTQVLYSVCKFTEKYSDVVTVELFMGTEDQSSR